MDAREREAFVARSTLPAFGRKVAKALSIIEEALALGPAYVSLSWGKDSVVMLHLCQQVQPDILAGFYGAPEQELIDNYQETEAKYVEMFPETRLHTVIARPEWAGTKATISDRLGLLPLFPVNFIGLRYEENPKKRGMSLSRYGEIHQYSDKTWRVCPLAWWKLDDVWTYIASRNLPYLKSYDLGLNRRTTPHLRHWLKHNGHAQQICLDDCKISRPEFLHFIRSHE